MANRESLREHPVFSNLPEKDINQFIQAAIARKFRKAEYVTHRGDIWPYLFHIQTGKFEAIKESIQGRSFVVETFESGEFFWGIGLFEADEQNPVAIRAAEDSEILVWDKSLIERTIAEQPQFSWTLFSLLARKMGRVSEILEGLVFQPLAGRLANLLIEQSGATVEGYVSRDLTLDDMAARLGSTREMVCKLLYRFSDQGLIELERTQFKIISTKKITELANSFK